MKTHDVRFGNYQGKGYLDQTITVLFPEWGWVEIWCDSRHSPDPKWPTGGPTTFSLRRVDCKHINGLPVWRMYHDRLFALLVKTSWWWDRDSWPYIRNWFCANTPEAQIKGKHD